MLRYLLPFALCYNHGGLAESALTTNITVFPAQKLGQTPVAPNFVSFSIEISSVLKMIGSDGRCASLAQAYRNLARLTPGSHAGPVLRLGGNSADSSCYGVNASSKCRYEITENDLQVSSHAIPNSGGGGAAHVHTLSYNSSTRATRRLPWKLQKTLTLAT